MVGAALSDVALGRDASAGEASPGPGPPRTSGRSSAAVPSSEGARPVSAATPPPTSGRGSRAVPASPASRAWTTASSCSSSFVGTRTTLANRKNARPAVRNRSPSDATFWMKGTGIGMMSPRINARTKKSDATPGTTMCSALVTSGGESPAAARLVAQIGMCPPLMTMTRPLSRMPTNATLSPG